MSRIRLSDNILLDTEEVVFSRRRDERDEYGIILGTWIPQTLVVIRGGCQQVLTGGAKAVFDQWAEGDIPSCQTCKAFNEGEERCTWTIGHVAFPKCYDGREEEGKQRGEQECAEYPHAVRSWVPKHNHIHPHDTVNDRGEPWHTEHNHEHPVGHHGQDEDGNYV